jgi:hypothetical protein
LSDATLDVLYAVNMNVHLIDTPDDPTETVCDPKLMDDARLVPGKMTY